MTADRSLIAAEIRATLAVAVPLAGANLGQMAMGVVNTAMVGHLSGTALAAVGLGGMVYFALVMLGQGVLTAVAPLAAHAIGAGERAAAAHIAGAGLVLAAVLAVPAVGLLTATPRLLGAFGYDPALVAAIGGYLRAIRWAAPASLAMAALRFLLVASFRARIVMAIPLAALPFSIALNWALIFGHLGAAPLGSTGSGWASAVMQWAMLAALALYVAATRTRVALAGLRPMLRDIGRILRLGAPISALMGLELGLFLAASIAMGLLGAAALAAHQLVMNVASVSFQVPLGVAQAATVRVAFQLGARAPAAARRAALVALMLGATFMTAMGVLFWTAPLPIAGLYVDLGAAANGALVAIALRLFAVAALFQVFDGVQVLAVGALRGYRDTALPMLFAAFGYWGVGFAGGWALAFPLGFGPVGLWVGLALGLAAVGVSLTGRLLVRARRETRGTGGGLPAAAGAHA